MKNALLSIFAIIALSFSNLAVQAAPPSPELQELFWDAVDEENVPLVRGLLKEGADPNALIHGSLALNFAAQINNIELVRVLIEHGARITNQNASGETALLAAIAQCNLQVLEFLLAQGGVEAVNIANVQGFTALYLLIDRMSAVDASVKEPYYKLVEQLLALKADPNKVATLEKLTPLHLAALSKDVRVARLLLDHGANVEIADMRLKRPLHVSALLNDPAMVELLLSRGANANAKDDKQQTPLLTAAGHGFEQIVELLLVKSSTIEDTCAYGANALLLAAAQGSAGVVKKLLIAGANPNALGGGVTPLCATVGQEIRFQSPARLEIIRSLLDWGAEINLPVFDGKDTALSIAIRREANIGMINMLLERGATVRLEVPRPGKNTKKTYVIDCLELARQKKRMDVVTAIRQRSGKALHSLLAQEKALQEQRERAAAEARMRSRCRLPAAGPAADEGVTRQGSAPESEEETFRRFLRLYELNIDVREVVCVPRKVGAAAGAALQAAADAPVVLGRSSVGEYEVRRNVAEWRAQPELQLALAKYQDIGPAFAEEFTRRHNRAQIVAMNLAGPKSIVKNCLSRNERIKKVLTRYVLFKDGRYHEDGFVEHFIGEDNRVFHEFWNTCEQHQDIQNRFPSIINVLRVTEDPTPLARTSSASDGSFIVREEAEFVEVFDPNTRETVFIIKPL